MPEIRQIPGVQTLFTAGEIRTLIEMFQCETMEDLTRAALRYESLFFMFTVEEDGIDLYPGQDMALALSLANYFAFSNFFNTSEPLERRYAAPPKRGPGRSRRPCLPMDTVRLFDEAKKLNLTNEEAVQRLISFGKIPTSSNKELKVKTVLRYIQALKRQKEEEELEQERRRQEAMEAFKDMIPKD